MAAPPPPSRDLSSKPSSQGPSSPARQLALSPQPCEPILTMAPPPQGASKPKKIRPLSPPKSPLSPRSPLPEIRLVQPPPRQPSPPPAWVILDCESWERKLPEDNCVADEEFSAVLADPPNISLIFAERNIYPNRLIKSRVLAADPLAALLVATVFEGGEGPKFLRLMGFEYDKRQWESPSHSPPHLIQKDVPDRQSAVAPDERLGNIGLITLSGGPANDYTVVELEITEGSNIAKLFTIRGHKSAEWCGKEIFCPLSHRAWASHGVISHNFRLWWVDLSWGLLSCNPSADQPIITFESLPCDSILEATTDDIKSYRYVGVSDENLCYLEISLECEVVSIWMHEDDGSGGWKHHVTAKFGDIWNDESYQSTKLPAVLPAVALVDPFEPNCAYFILENMVFGVDLRTKCTSCVGDRDECCYTFLPWILPTVGNMSTSDLRDEALRLLKVVKDVPVQLKNKLFQIVRSSKVMEECMIHIDENIDNWPIKNFNEQEIYSSVSADGIFSERELRNPNTAEQETSELLSSSTTAEQEKIQNILNQIVSSVVADLEVFYEIIHMKILKAILGNLDEETGLVRSYYFSKTLEDIGEAEAIKILSSGIEFEFLKSCKEHGTYLFELAASMEKIAAMMRGWDKQHYELERAWVEAAATSNRGDPHDTQSKPE